MSKPNIMGVSFNYFNSLLMWLKDMVEKIRHQTTTAITNVVLDERTTKMNLKK